MDATYTAEQLRERARNLRANGHPMGAHECEAHADALDENARLKGAWGASALAENARLKAAWDASHKQAMKNGAARNEWRDRAERAEAELAALREQLAERDAEIAALKGHAEALRNRLVEEYTIGPCVDQTVGAALPHEVYDFDAAYPKE